MYNKLFHKVLFKTLGRYPEFFSKNFRVLFSKYIFFSFTGKILNLEHPKNLSEKIMWLKLNYNNPLIPLCTDKYLVRDYLKSKGYSNLLNELYGVFDSADDIDFEKLPNKFALKANHGCGYNIICNNKDELDIAEAKKKLNHWLHSTYGTNYGEWHYALIKPRIIAEKFLESPINQKSIVDYKIHCINGKPQCINVYYNRTENSKNQTSYNLNWERIYILKKEDSDCERPANLEKMIKIAQILSEPFPYVRVDLYEINVKIYFGELTFTPYAGMQVNFKDEALERMGENLILP